MPNGFVYILLNPSFPDQVKLGQTSKGSELRAGQLWSKGVPTPFIVVYDELVSDPRIVERRLHERFAAYRVNAGREFFRIPVREAVRALQEEAKESAVAEAGMANRIDITKRLREKYPNHLRDDIAEVFIVQPPGISFLEVTRRPHEHLRDEIVERLDLSFIGDVEGEMFPATDQVEENASRFVDEFDAYSIIMTTNLFSEAAAKRVAAEWERSGGRIDKKRKGPSGDAG